jgi:hypothetical protein
MDVPRRTLRATLVASAFAAIGCASASDRYLSVETYPPGASVRLGVDGRAAGQTPLDKLHVEVGAGERVLLIIEKDQYQTVAVPVESDSPRRIFVCLQRAPDTDALLQAIKELQSSVSNISATVTTIRADLDKRGGN